MQASHTHPARLHMLRGLNASLVLGSGWLLWVTTGPVIADANHLTPWHLFYLAPVAICVTLALAFAAGVRQPSRHHLVLAMAFGVVGVGAVSFGLVFDAVTWLIRPEAIAAFQNSFFLLTLYLLVNLAIYAEWKIAKGVGFVPKDQAWWCEAHLRGYFTFTGWMLFFLGITLSEQLTPVLQPAHDPAVIQTALFLGLIAFCYYVGHGFPRILMALTGIDPQPKPRRRGFRLF